MFRRLVPFALVLAAYIIAPRLKENLCIPQRFGFLLYFSLALFRDIKAKRNAGDAVHGEKGPKEHFAVQ